MNNTIFPPVPVLKEQAKAALRQAGPAMTKASLVYIGITLIVNYALQGTAPEGKELQVFALTMLVICCSICWTSASGDSVWTAPGASRSCP